jgi:hypothetical protein
VKLEFEATNLRHGTLGEQVHRSVQINVRINIFNCVCDWKARGYHANTTLRERRCVQQSSLNVNLSVWGRRQEEEEKKT